MAIDQLTEEVATNLEEVAEATRKLNTVGLSYLAVGLGIGAAVGFYFGYKFNRKKITAEVYKEAEEQISAIREVYLEKTVAAENLTKPSAEDIVAERGYSVVVPERERPLPAPVPVSPAHRRVTVEVEDVPEEPADTSKSVNEGWDYEKELKGRSPEAPYVIHQNEYEHSNPEYSKVVYTYYDIDDVLTDSEDERPILDGGDLVGRDNLKFGHGSDDTNVVYVRNDEIEIDMQICRVHRSYEEEVLGLSRHDHNN